MVYSSTRCKKCFPSWWFTRDYLHASTSTVCTNLHDLLTDESQIMCAYYVKHFIVLNKLLMCGINTSLFTFRQGNDMEYLFLYVDDIILCTSSDDLCDRLISHLKTEFSMSDLRTLNYFLGISVTHTPSFMLLSQQKYA